MVKPASSPPQDCRSRGDCGRRHVPSYVPSIFTASRLPQSRRLRQYWRRTVTALSAASRLPQSRRLRLRYCAVTRRCRRTRLKIAAVAATAARCIDTVARCRRIRLKIAAVAATAAARLTAMHAPTRHAASRLPQSRRLRLTGHLATLRATDPPQDCRSRGDCGAAVSDLHSLHESRLKIAAVAATAAAAPGSDGTCDPPQDCRSRGDCGRGLPAMRHGHLSASRLPQSRRLRHMTRC